MASDELECKTGQLSDRCNNCYGPNLTPNEILRSMTTGGCGNVVRRGGNGDVNVDFLLTTVYDKVNEYLKKNQISGLTKSREGTFIIGYSLGGLLACFAAWTRPTVRTGLAVPKLFLSLISIGEIQLLSLNKQS